MPYLKFPDNWPVFSPKDKIADWLELDTKIMELNDWPDTEATSAAYDEAARQWVVQVERDGELSGAPPGAARAGHRDVGAPELALLPGHGHLPG